MALLNPGSMTPTIGKRVAVHHKRIADDAGIGVETRLPVVKAENNDGIAALAASSDGTESAECGLHSQHVEVIAGDQLAGVPAQVGRSSARRPGLRVRDKAGEDGVLVAELAVRRVGEVVVFVAAVEIDVAGVEPS